MDISNWISLGELIVAIIGIVVGFIGGKELKQANNIKAQIDTINSRIDKIEVSNSQIAHTINNNGLGYKDTKDVARDIVKQETEDFHGVILSESEPNIQNKNDEWLQEYK